MRERANKISRK